MNCPILTTGGQHICANCGRRSSTTSLPRCPEQSTVVGRVDNWVQSDEAARIGDYIIVGIALAALMLLVGYGFLGPYWMDLLGDGP